MIEEELVYFQIRFQVALSRLSILYRICVL